MGGIFGEGVYSKPVSTINKISKPSFTDQIWPLLRLAFLASHGASCFYHHDYILGRFDVVPPHQSCPAPPRFCIFHPA